MAKASAAPPDDEDEDETEEGGEDPHGDGETVLCTVCKTADGAYVVHEGDEPEDEQEDGEGEEPGEGEEAGGGEGGEQAGSEGEHYTSIGAVLKAVMEILQKDEEGEGGSAEDNFAAGYGAEPKPLMAAAPAGKY